MSEDKTLGCVSPFVRLSSLDKRYAKKNNSLPSVIMHRVISIPCTSDGSDPILGLTGIVEELSGRTARMVRSTTPPSVKSYG